MDETPSLFLKKGSLVKNNSSVNRCLVKLWAACALLVTNSNTLAQSDEASAKVAGESRLLQPVLEGDWWPIAGNPDLGEIGTKGQQPVDFGVWQAADGTWQLWSCIRHTREPGKTRLFYGWEGKSIADHNWTPVGVKMRANPRVGETAGGLQAPHVIRGAHSNDFLMFYGDWNNICLARSPKDNGKAFSRVVQSNQSSVTAMFTEGAGTNTRDAMVIFVEVEQLYYCYYCAGVGFRSDGAHNMTGAVYCRTSKDLVHWSESKIVSRGGRTGTSWGAHECPHVVSLDGYYYLFRTQRYGGINISHVYRSKDPLDFGIGNDEDTFVCTLPVAAPELVNHEGQWYIAALNPGLNGIRISRLEWQEVKE